MSLSSLFRQLGIACSPRNVSESTRDSAGLTLHHVVPYQYRKEMPLSFKSHGSHDVLPLCVDDHEIYEHFAESEKLKLVEKYDAPLTGRSWIKHTGHSFVRAAAAALSRYRAAIPADIIAELERIMMAFFSVDAPEQISNEMLQEAMQLKSLERELTSVSMEPL